MFAVSNPFCLSNRQYSHNKNFGFTCIHPVATMFFKCFVPLLYSTIFLKNQVYLYRRLLYTPLLSFPAVHSILHVMSEVVICNSSATVITQSSYKLHFNTQNSEWPVTECNLMLLTASFLVHTCVPLVQPSWAKNVLKSEVFLLQQLQYFILESLQSN